MKITAAWHVIPCNLVDIVTQDCNFGFDSMVGGGGFFGQRLRRKHIDPVNDNGILIILWLPFVMCSAYNKPNRISAQLRPERKQQKILSLIELIRPHKIRLHFSLMYLEYLGYCS
jgi:hypothetical protein